jgi:imidazole glycerol-phosphate synthase subunit HisH
MQIVVPDLAIGNFASVLRMVERAGGSARLGEAPASLRQADRIILAGVGAFDRGMANLHQDGWADDLAEAVMHRRVPVLGICLGMQLMCTSSEEGRLPGLGWMDAEVRRFDPARNGRIKVPHMGWNSVTVTRSNPLLPVDDTEQRFYFVHSYYVDCRQPGDVLAHAHHGQSFVAAFNRQNIYGVQFHPEKSHRFGMALLRNFMDLKW